MLPGENVRALNILLAIDGSQHSYAAIEMLKELNLNPKSVITAIGVLIPRESSNHALLEAALEQARLELQNFGYNAQSEIHLGYPTEKIVEISEERNPDLIILGAKGLRHTLGILLGGVAQQVVEYARQPVIVVRAPYQKLNKILVVIDGSVASQAVIDYLAGSRKSAENIFCEPFPLPASAQITIMHVLPPLPSPEAYSRAWPIGPDIMPTLPVETQADQSWLAEEEEQGQNLLARTVNFLNTCSRIQAYSYLTRGDAATEIIEYAKEHQFNLIIAGSRGFSQVRGWLLGSVSRKLVHYAACSVLIVKGLHQT